MFSLWIYIVVIFIVLVVGFIAAYRTSVDKDQKCAVALAFLTLFVIVGCYACVGQEGDLTLAAVFLGLVLVLPVAVYSLTLKIRIVRQKHAALLNSEQDVGKQAAVQRTHSAAQTSAQQKKSKKRIVAQQKEAKRQAAQLQKSAVQVHGAHKDFENIKGSTAVTPNADDFASTNDVSEAVADALLQNEGEDEVLFDADASNKYGQSESTEMETSDAKAAADAAVPTEAKKSDRAQETYRRPQRNHRHDQWHKQRHETAPMYSGAPAEDTIGRRRAAAERQLAQAKEAVRNRQPQESQPVLDQKIKQDKSSTSAASPDYVRPPMYRKASFADARERAQAAVSGSMPTPMPNVAPMLSSASAQAPMPAPVSASTQATTPASTVPPAATAVSAHPQMPPASAAKATAAVYAQAASVQETQTVQTSIPTPAAPVQAAQAPNTALDQASVPAQEVPTQTQTTPVPTVIPTTQTVQANPTEPVAASAASMATMASVPAQASASQLVAAPTPAVAPTPKSVAAPTPAVAPIQTAAPTPISVVAATPVSVPQSVAAPSQAASEPMNAIPAASSEPAPAHTIPVTEASTSNISSMQKPIAQETECDQKMRVCNNFAQMADMLRTEGSHEKALALYARAFHFAWDDATRRDIAFKIIASAINSNHPEEAYHFANILSEECGTLSKTEMVKLSFILKSIQKLL